MKNMLHLKKYGSRLRSLLFTVLMLAFLLLLSFAVIYTMRTTKAMEEEVSGKLFQSVGQTQNNLDYRFSMISDNAFTLMSSIYPYLNADGGVPEQMLEYNSIETMFGEYAGKHMITRLRLRVPDKKIYRQQHSGTYSVDPLSEAGADLTLYGNGGIFWKEPERMEYGITGDYIDALSCVVSMRSRVDYSRLSGILYADVSLPQIRNILEAGSGSGEKMFLVNEAGTILCDADDSMQNREEIDQKTMERIVKERSGYFTDQDRFVAFSKLDSVGWYLVTTEDRSHVRLSDPASAARIGLLWLASGIIFFLILTMAAYSLNLNRIVGTINTSLEKLRAEGTKGSEEESGNGRKTEKAGPFVSIRTEDFGRLEKGSEEIVRSVSEILEERYKDRLAVSEYQMKSLQAQIKPHFLYNTLDVIKWMILDNRPDDSVWMVNALSKYLRMSINKGPDIVPLSEELDLTKTYLGIMLRRFDHKFTVEYDLDDAASTCLIPKLSLQPLVENALLHGILNCDKQERHLVLRTWYSGKTFGVEVEDNGTGMTEEKAAELEKLDSGKSYGILNVHRRLKIFAKEECVFRISSREGLGTCVSIELPVSKN